MQLIKTTAILAAAASGVAAAMSPCDTYTVALLKNNTAANQLALLTLLVNTVVIGNFTGPGTKNPSLPGSKVAVPGILTPGTYKGESVNLAPYFTGALASTDLGSGPVAVNWLDGGGATPILADPTSSGTAGSHQSTLLNHLYQYFGLLLGCSMMGTSDFPSYEGVASMAQVHQYMDITPAELGYFITQVGLAAESFGVPAATAAAIGAELNKVFGYRCSAPIAVIPNASNTTQAICQNSACPMASPASCAAYIAATPPATASAAAASGSSSAAASSAASGTASAAASGTASAAASGSASAAASMSTAGARATMIPAAFAGLAGLAVLAL